jgi:DNA-binding beta-propeller fold protein YncE
MRARSILAAGILVPILPSLVRAPASPGSLQAPAKQAPPVQVPRFEVDPMWPKPLPNRWILGSATGVAVDGRDHIYVVHLTDSFNARTEIGLATNPPTGECCAPAPNVLELDAAGNLLGKWGPAEGANYRWPEMNAGIAVDPRSDVWIGGAGGADAQILKFSREGRFLAQFGKAHVPAVAQAARAGDTTYQGVSPPRAAPPRGGRRPATPALPANSNNTESFGGPAGFAFDARASEVYVADGFRNHRVAVLDMATGAIKRYWGAYGKMPNDADSTRYDPSAPLARQFSTVRCVELSRDDLVYVCDARNDRIQVFRKNGMFVKEARVAPQTLGEGSVWDIAFSSDPRQRYLYVADGMNMKVHVLDRETLQELTSFGDGGRQPGQFYGVHSIATDSRGNVYTVETYEGKRVQKFVYKGLGEPTRSAVPWPGGTR